VAKQIVVVDDKDNVSTFDFKKITRSMLQGKIKRRAIGPDGEVCTRASVTKDGSLVLQSGMTAQGYFKKGGGEGGGQWVPNGEVIGLDLADRPVEQVPSTLGEAQLLEGPVDVEDYLDLQQKALYALDAVELHPSLKKSLDLGDIYRLPFNYRTDYEGLTAYLLSSKEDGGYYLKVGSPAPSEWLKKTEIAVETFEDDPSSDGDDDDDDLMDF